MSGVQLSGCRGGRLWCSCNYAASLGRSHLAANIEHANVQIGSSDRGHLIFKQRYADLAESYSI